MKPIRVLVVDDSPLVRVLLTDALSSAPGLEVVGSAGDAYEARDKIVAYRPDVLTLDVEMPRMTGVDFLRRLIPQYPIPVVMVSALTAEGAQVTLDALDAGAVDFVTKPSTDFSYRTGLDEMLRMLVEKVRLAATVDVRRLVRPQGQQRPPRIADDGPPPPGAVVAMGASTGGTEALSQVLSALPAHFPPTLVVQHMPARYTRVFAERLDRACALRVVEAADGMAASPGTALVAPGGMHMRLVEEGGTRMVRLDGGERVNGHRPSADPLFESVAALAGRQSVGVLLTGMGDDGARGLKKMKLAGARTIVQDEATSVVWGMPKVAYEMGAAEKVLPLQQIAAAVVERVRLMA